MGSCGGVGRTPLAEGLESARSGGPRKAEAQAAPRDSASVNDLRWLPNNNRLLIAHEPIPEEYQRQVEDVEIARALDAREVVVGPLPEADAHAMLQAATGGDRGD